MKLAIISDIHANIFALNVVLKELMKGNTDKILCSGDIIGYNPFPNEVIEIFRQRKIFTILGNHDFALLKNDTSWFNELGIAGIEYTKKVIKEENLIYLKNLKRREFLEIENRKIAIVHGSPRDDDEYVYENSLNEEFLEIANCEILIYGHTHIPCIKRFEKGIILNSGSVGQPRDRDNRGSYMIFDLENLNAEIKRVAYDIKSVENEIIKVGLPYESAKRLSFGI